MAGLFFFFFFFLFSYFFIFSFLLSSFSFLSFFFLLSYFSSSSLFLSFFFFFYIFFLAEIALGQAIDAYLFLLLHTDHNPCNRVLKPGQRESLTWIIGWLRGTLPVMVPSLVEQRVVRPKWFLSGLVWPVHVVSGRFDLKVTTMVVQAS